MRKLFIRLASLLASIALFVGITSVNAPSAILYHQPKVPKGLEKYRK